ncbi:VCBS domain-containing protein [Novipirellula sp. SH528]|uniref:VCBS domain-containing protein n=1 Tax=Novipirellula sp. SH528 TaxID=3454466 RepID=UPI003FA0538E
MSREFDFYPLEERILLSGEGVDGLDGSMEIDFDLEAALLSQLSEADGEVVGDLATPAAQPLNTDHDVIDIATVDVAEAEVLDPAQPIEVIFVDAGVEDAETLIEGLRADADGQTQWLIVRLQAEQDGILQITETLRNLTSVDAVHLLSHGDGEGIQLGNSRLDLDAAPNYAGEIASWGHALDSGADLLIYGCDLASTESGRDLIDILAVVCDCDVAASDNATGNAELGGDWILEYAVGEVNTEVAFGFAAQASWQHTLDISSNLVLHHRFDTDTSDSSGNNYNGTLQNGAVIDTTSGTNQIGDGKLSLDGINDYVDFSPHVSNLQGITAGTISVWVYHDVNDRDVIFETSDSGDSDSRVALFRDSDGSFDFYIREGSTTLLDVHTAAGVIPQNTWTHVAVTVDATGNKLYVNGVQQSVTYATGSSTTNRFFDDVTQLDFGSWGVDKYSGSSFTRYFDGFLDDGRVYDRALSSTDISELYAATGTGTSVVSFQQGVNSYTGTQDTELRQTSPGSNYGSYTTLPIDLQNSGSNTESQAMIRFDDLFGTGPGQIPINAQIVSASLTVEALSGTSGTISLYQMLNDWDESTATWSTYTDGLDADNVEMSSVADSQLTSPSTGAVTFTGLESAVQSWADGNANYGWGILTNSTDGFDFYSSEGTTKPKLSIEYVMPASQLSTAHALVVDTASDVWDGDTTSIDSLLANKGSDGKISLREAILAANSTQNNGATPDQISFAIGSGTQTILVGAGGLPIIVDAVNIDARTQPGYTSSPLITIDGSGATGSTGGLVLRTNDSTISGFAVINFPDEGIEIDGSTGYGDNNIIQYNYVGLTASGTAAGNADNGILLSEDADDNIVRNNVVGSNGNDGIVIRNTDSDNNWIYGNTVGLAPDGTTIRANGRYGVSIFDAGTNNIIGSDGDNVNDAAERNVISGNASDGIYLYNAGGTTIRGNYVGTDNAGTAIRGNAGYGMLISNSSSVTIDANVVSGNSLAGISLWETGTTLATVTSNYIGTNAAGTSALGNSNDGIKIGGGASNNTIGGDRTLGLGNVISGNSGATSDGIELSGSAGSTNDNKIYGNYIGTDATGTTAIANGRHGIVVFSGAQNTLIGGTGSGQGNIISGNTTYGIIVDGNNGTTTTGTVIAANYIGLNLAGTSAIANGGGISLFSGARSTTIGGTTAAHRNVISGNTGVGIEVTGATTQNNTIRGNYIGTNQAGTAGIGNGGSGIYTASTTSTAIIGNVISANTGNGISTFSDANITIQSNLIGLNAAGSASLVNTGSGVSLSNVTNGAIGGIGAGEGNVINAASGQSTLYINNGSGSTIYGNFLGTNAAGTAALSGGSISVSISNAANTLFGGTTSAHANVIGGYSVTGINVTQTGSAGTQIQGNFIGTDATGTADLTGGFYGITIQSSALGIMVGGTKDGAGNTIAYHSTNGIRLWGTAGIGNSILQNRIYANGALGIDIGGDGVTDNDSDDVDTGPNNKQNFPVITEALLDGTNLTLAGSLDTDGALNTQYHVEFYGNASGTQDTTHGEGRYYLGTTTVTVDGSGDGTFSGVVLTGVTLSAGDFVTATATRIDDPGQVDVNDQMAYGDTSEFAANFAIAPINSDPVVTFGGGNITYVENAGAVFIDATATVTDADGADFDGGVLSISITANGSGDDRIRINNEGMAAGLVGMTTGPNEVYYGGVLIGTWSGSGAPLAITFNASADATAVQAVVQNITFENISDVPSSLTRTIEFQLTDGDGGTSTAITKDIDVTAVNDAPTFGSDGDGSTTVPIPGSLFDLGFNSVVQADGKIVMVGSSYFTDNDITVVRFNTNGTLDLTFGGGDGIATLDAGGGELGMDVALQADGRIVVAGTRDSDLIVARFTATGVLDTTFDSDGYAITDVNGTDSASGIAIQSDGKIVVLGNTDAGGNNFSVVRYNTDGSLDTTFSGDGKVEIDFGASSDDVANSILIQSDGKIVVAGKSNNQFALARLTSGGVLDTSFDSDGLVTTDFGVGDETISGLAQQSDGKIIAAGTANLDIALARYNTDGSLDTSFDGDGLQTSDLGATERAYSVALTSTEKIVVSGITDLMGSNDVMLQRYNADGSLDTGFNTTGTVITVANATNEYAYSAQVLGNGAISIAGNMQNNGFLLNQYNEDGSLDTSFAPTANLVDANPTYVEGSAAIVLDASVSVFDRELSAQDNFSGSTIALVRRVGVNGEDVFGFNDGNGLTMSTGSLYKNGQIVATIDLTSPGLAVVTFTDSNGETPTQTDVNNVLRQFTYANNSDSPPASVELLWYFVDGNGGDQGTGGSHFITGVMTVNITATNDDPTNAGSLPSDITVTEDVSGNVDLSQINLSDVDEGGGDLTVTLTTSTGGNLSASSGGGVTVGGSGTGVLTMTGTLADLNTYLDTASNIQYLHSTANQAGDNADTITVSVNDNGNTGTGGGTDINLGTVNVDITNVNDAPVITSDGGGDTANINVDENSTAVTIVTASDADLPSQTLTYSIFGGVDAAKFNINSSDGTLIFVAAPDFESPADVGGDNVYDVIVRVSDGTLTDDQAIAVTVIDVSNVLVVTTATDNNDSGILVGASYDIEWLNANKGTDGEISLREAIIAANNTAGMDTVSFNIAGAGVHTIGLLSVLPSITEAITIDGYTQSGSSINTATNGSNAVLQIELDGTNTGAGASGLKLVAGSDGSTIRGLAINRFSGSGVEINNSDNNTIVGNFLGTSVDGTSGQSNVYGVNVTNGANNNTIGGSAAGDRNVISGNTTAGVYISSSDNTVAGNVVGLNAAGNAAIANTRGVYLLNAANTLIGGTSAGAGNVISGNSIDGVLVTGAASTGTRIEGNYIGTNAAGDAGIANLIKGVGLTTNATGVTVGGSAAGAGNVISGNSNTGVYIASDGNLVTGNFVGINAAGTAAVANGTGVYIYHAANNTIGGTSVNERNIISGNTSNGVYISGSGSTGNKLQGNYIGTNAAGDAAVANTAAGVSVAAGATNNAIGGSVAGAGNVISGNSTYGVYVNASNNTVAGNTIGLNAAGTAAIANNYGIHLLNAANNVIGGTTTEARNVISGNSVDGIYISGATSTGNSLQGNFIGTNAAGTAAISNGRFGISLINNASANTIGGAVSGAGNLISGNVSSGVYVSASDNTLVGNTVGLNATGTAAIANYSGIYVNNVSGTTIGGTTALARNVISGNTSDGVFITGASATGNLVQGNYIGTNTAGTSGIANINAGINIQLNASGNTVGGAVAGAGNVISGNQSMGVYVAAPNNTLSGNIVGLNAAGNAKVANAGFGIYVTSAGVGTSIGGTTSLQRNVVSGNGADGIVVDGGGSSSAMNVMIQGNYVGTNLAGTSGLSNSRHGVYFYNAAATNTLGGAVSGAGNVISGNASYGVLVEGTSNLVAGNTIGLDAAGTAAIANSTGVYINNVGSTTIGGTTALARNVISGNTNDGIYITGAAATGNLVQGNYIGTNATGTAAVGNGNAGINIASTAAGNTIGGTAAGAGNLISGNTNYGVYTAASNTTFQGNFIGTDAAGTGAIANGAANSATGGIYIAGGSGSTIGGTTTSARNVISGNGGAGIWINAGGDTTTIQGNYIGVDVTGDTAFGNGRWGVVNQSGDNVQIGGTAAGAGNVISGSTNSSGGVFIGPTADGTVIEGNRIGIGATTTSALSSVQVVGIWLASGSTNTRIGGTTAPAGNIIAGNGVSGGIKIVGTSTGNTIQRNSIYGNSGIGIDLNDDGTTTNDGAKTGGAANLLMDSPVVGTANLVSNDLLLTGYVGSAANQATFANSRVEFFISDESSAYGSGQTYLGELTTDASGNFSGTLDVTGLGLTQSASITATATDSSGNTSEFGVNFAVNVAPAAVTDNATAVEAGGVGNATAGTNPTGNVLANDTDPDSGDTQTVIGVAAGTVGSASSNVGSNVTGSFGTLQIAANGAYVYTVDNTNTAVQALRNSGDTLTDVFTYTMNDSGGMESTTQVTITIEGANDAPEAADLTKTIDEDTPLTLAAADFGFTDVDSSESISAVRIDVLPAAGTLNLTGSGPVTAGQVITIADINAGKLIFIPAANDNGAGYASIAFSVADASNTFDGSPNTITIDVTAVNDAPELDNSETFTLTDITEDQTSNSGDTVASIIASLSGNRITDVDASPSEGIAIQSISGGNGTWQYSLDGSSWTDVGTVNTTTSLLLRSSDYLRYVPDAMNADTSSVSFVAWDQTTGTEGTKVSTAATGGITEFSADVGLAEVTVTAVNDAPTITDSATVSLSGTNEDTPSTPTSVDSIVSSAGWADVDAGAAKGIAVTALTGNGTWQYSTDGSTWTSFSGISGSTALLLNASTQIRYQPDSLNGETATFDFVAWDTTTGSASSFGSPSYADPGVGGSTTAFSSESATASTVVTDVNDAVVAVADTDTATEAGGVANATAGSNPSGNVLSNDIEYDTGDTLNVTGVAAGTVASAAGNVGTSVTGTYGNISIASNGAYTYTVDNNNAIVQALRTSGQTITDTFTYTVQDSGGSYSSTQIVITIEGQNDAPVAVTDNVVAVEAGGDSNASAGTNPTGNVLTNDTDVDSGDTKTVTGVVVGTAGSASGNVASALAGNYGSITINANGSYTYNVDNSNAAVQALRTSSDTLQDVFTYTMQDTDGASSTTQVTVTIQGQNDDPVAVDDNAAAVEAGGTSNGSAGTNPSGNVLSNDTDVDSGDTKTVVGVAAGSQSVASGSVATGVSGSYGSIQIASDGSYTYTVDNNNSAVQALRTSGQSLSEVFTYTIQDASGADSTAEITVTITGANDAPDAVANAATATEASGILNNISGTNPSGNVLTNDTDVDTGDTKTVTGVATGVQGSTSGNVGSTVVGTYGSLVINANGSYTYTLDNDNAAVEALNDGDSLSETFSYTMQDTAGLASTTQLVITIDGRTDQPVAVADMDTSEEAGGVGNATPGSNPSGNVLDNDLSGNGKTIVGVAAGSTGSASGNVGTTVTGTYGTVVINSDGTYTYTLDNSNPAVEALLTSGDHVTDIFTYSMEDTFSNMSSTELTITVDGQNDAPDSVDDTGIAVEAGGIANGTAGSNGTGNVLSNDTDVDTGDTKSVIGVQLGTVGSASGSVGASVTGNYGQIVINSDGSYTYTIDQNNAAVQALRTASDTLQEVYTYTMHDTAGLESTAQVTVTIQGANDAPVAVVDTATAYEAGGAGNGSAGADPSGNVLSNDTDVDSGDTKTVIGVASGVQASASGSVATGVVGSYGSITLNSDGSYTYVVDNDNAAVQALRTSGQKLDDVFTYTVEDTDGLSSTTQITVSVRGANDNPDVVADTAIAVEAGGTANGTAGTNPTGNVLANDSDNDAGDTMVVSGVTAGTAGSATGSVGSSVAGLFGSINIASNGNYSYTVDNSNPTVQDLLNSGDTLTDIFTYTVEDLSGATSTTQVTITIQGANDAPVATVDSAHAYEAGGVANGTAGTDPSGNVLSNDDQVDSGDTWSITGAAQGVVGSTSGSVGSSINGNFGAITINSDGSYTYNIDNDNATVQGLRTASDTITDVFSYTVSDAAGLNSTAQITITLHGANDDPVAVVDTPTAVSAGGYAGGTAGTDPTGNVLTNDTDVDAGDTKTVDGVAAGVQASASGSVGSAVTGSYGSISIAANGSYTYTVDNNNATVQALRTSSDTLTDVFTYTMIDASGAASTTQVSVTIQGANDAPIGVDDTATAVEAGGVGNATAGTNPTGNVLSNDTDLDSGDTKSVSGVAAGSQVSASGSVATGVSGSFGQITINSDGSYSYVVDNNNVAVQALRTSGDTLTDVFTYTMVDTAGLDSTAEITVTIQGSNDNPVATADTPTAVEAGGLANGTAGTDPTGNVLSNDTDVDAGDSKTVAGVAAGVQASASGSVGSAVTGSYGSVTINSDGSYIYAVDNSNAAVQALRTASDTLQDVFTYTVVDASGADATTQVTITIQGQNDTPTAVVDNAVAVEAGGTANGTAGTDPTGNVLTNDTDVDSVASGETKSVSGVAAGVAGSASGSVASSVAGSYGAITINSDGSYSYIVDNNNTAVQALRNSGQTLNDVFTYTMTDTAGATSTTQITVTIQGQNDAPTAVADNPIAVESGGLANGTAGTDPTGNVLTNDLDPDSAGNGETKTVTGIAVGVVGSASGSVASSVTGSYGAITINSDGSYAYVVDNSNVDVQALRNSGQTLDDVFTYTMTDADGVASTTQVTVTIQGQNDTPTAVVDNAVAVEAGGLANGTAGTNPTGNVLTNDTDVDSVGNGETKSVSGVAAGVSGSASGSVASSVAGSYGAITINSDGSYSYVVDNNNATVQALRNSGQTLDDVFTYTMTDTAGATSTTQITVTIQGQNDSPTAVADNPIAVESGGLANGTAGTDPTGNVLTNDLDPDSAANGETKTVTGVVVGVTGSASGSVATSVTGSYGAITITSDGSYAYVVDNSNTDVQALRNSGQTLDDVFTYTMTDADGVASTTQVTVTIQGQNDTPTAVVDNAIAVEAGGTANGTAGTNPTGNVLTNDTDVDSVGNGETKSVSGVAAGVTGSASGSVASSVAGSYGVITINSDGSYSYVVDNNNATVQALRNSGDTLDDVFTYTMTDTAGATSTTQITVTIQGQNDTPTAVVDNAIAVESGGLANGTAGTDPTGNVLTNDTDVDSIGNGETKTVSGVAAGVTGSASGSVASSVAGTYGAITINSDGSYSYVVDNSNTTVQALRDSGDTLDDVFTYTMTDTAGATSTTQITVTIQGQNDTPTAVVDYAIAVEAGGLVNGTAGTNPTGNVLTNDTDVDSVGNGETKSVSGVAAGVAGSASGSVASSVAGSYGAITINNDGSYSYVVDNNNATVQALRNSGDTLDDVFTYTMTDTAGATSTTQITVTIQGQNDTPTAVVDNAIAVESGGLANGTSGTDPTGNVLTNDTDVDSVGNGETKTVSGVAAGVTGSASGSVASSIAGSYGAITINADGSYSYIVDNSNATVQALRNSGQTLDDVFTYTMTDTAGATSTTQITVTIQGQNDTPTAVVDTAIAVESGGLANGTAGTNPTGNVLTNDTDVDSIGNGETKTVSGVAAGVAGSASGSVASSVAGSYGAITINSDGSYSYIVDNNNASVQALRNSGDTLDDVFTYTMTDTAGATSTTQITVTIQGQNDTPTAVVDNAIAVESGGLANGTAGTDPTGNVLTNDTDVDSIGNGETKTVSGVAAGVTGSASGSVASSVAGSYGAITINSDGSYSYAVDNNNSAVEALRNSGDTLDDVFTYTMTDAAGTTSTTQITVTIQGQNDTPIANADTATAVEAGGVANGTAGVDPTGYVLTNDTDTDSVGNGETKTVSGVVAGTAASATGSVGANVSGSYGAITINSDGSYSYVVDNNNAAVEALRTASDTLTDVFTYTMVDASGAESTEQVTITIQGQNDAPHDLTATGMTIDEGLANGQIVGTISTDDIDTSDTTLYSLTDTAGGRFNIDASGNIRVADSSQLDYEAATQHDITVRVQDAAGATYDETFTVYLNDVNEFNVSAATDTDGNPNQVNENAAFGTTVGITALAVDTDGSTNSVTYSLSDDAGGRFAIDSASGIVTVSGSVDYETATNHTITVRADSSDGSFSFANFSIAVIDVNEAPVAIGDNYSINAGETLTLAAPGVLINDSDVDGDPLQLQLVSGPSHGVLTTSANGSLVYTPSDAYFGGDTFTYLASDGSLDSNVVTVTITVIAGGGGGGSGSGGSGGSGSGDGSSGDSGSGDTGGSGDTSGGDSGNGDSDDGNGDGGSTTTGAVPTVPTNVTTPTQSDNETNEKGASKPTSASAYRESTIQMSDNDNDESQGGFESQSFSWGGSSNMQLKRSSSQMSQMLDQLLIVDLVQAIQWTEWNEQSAAQADNGSFFGVGEIGGLGVGAGLASVGYVLWALRGGVLLTTIFGSMPAWRMIDPSALLTVYRDAEGVRNSKADVSTFLD